MILTTRPLRSRPAHKSIGRYMQNHRNCYRNCFTTKHPLDDAILRNLTEQPCSLSLTGLKLPAALQSTNIRRSSATTGCSIKLLPMGHRKSSGSVRRRFASGVVSGTLALLPSAPSCTRQVKSPLPGCWCRLLVQVWQRPAVRCSPGAGRASPSRHPNSARNISRSSSCSSHPGLGLCHIGL